MWDEALQTCYMEGGILVVIENENEAVAINDFLSSGSKYHIGIRKLTSRHDYYTIKGSKRADVYNLPWSNEETESECGAIFYANQYNTPSTMYTTTVECAERLPYICEMDARQP